MKKRKYLYLILLLLLLFPNSLLLAQLNPEVLNEAYLNELGKETPVLEEGDLVKILFSIIQYLLGFIGVIAVVVIIAGGYLWMTAGGNEEKVKKAKEILLNGLIGLGVILVAFLIVRFVIRLIRGE